MDSKCPRVVGKQLKPRHSFRAAVKFPARVEHHATPPQSKQEEGDGDTRDQGGPICLQRGGEGDPAGPG